ncbi:MAG: SUMF1/EgtB/PvdO family nonheme iron enzyme [Planctomycetaceae bacterium]|nr:SUMF1/EgtB/PvdO family nonheme iron enzyme [Planctomycetaceae bacterium]
MPASGDQMSHFDPYYTWLGIPPEEQPADFYRLLGIRRYESNAEVIVNAADQRMAYLRTFQAGKRGAESQKLLNEVSSAQVCLLDAAKKRAYDERLSRENAEHHVATVPASVIPVPLAQPLPLAQPIQPQIAPLAAATTFAQPARAPLPHFAQPLPALKPPERAPAAAPPQSDWLRPSVLAAAAASAALFLLLIVGGVIWASRPRPKPPTPVVIIPPEKSARPGPSAVSPPAVAQPRPSASRPPAPPLLTVPFTEDEARDYQAAWAGHLEIPVETTNSLGMKLQLIPPGKFPMGAATATVHAPFYLAACEVTVAQFRKFATDAGYKTTAEQSGKGVTVWDSKRREGVTNPQWTWSNLPYPVHDDHPVGGLSWDDAMAVCQWLSQREGRTYFLPDDAQWEFACRAGSAGAWHWGDDEQLADRYAWTHPTAGSQPAGSKLPNAFGLFDMHGSATEWCANRVGSGVGSAEMRAVRGGSINTENRWTKSGYRRGQPRDQTSNAVGLRVALLVPGSDRGEGTIADSDAPAAPDPAGPAADTLAARVAAERAAAERRAAANPASVPMPPADDAAVKAALDALRAKGVQAQGSPTVRYVHIGDVSLTAQEIDGLKLFPLQMLNLVGCSSAPLVLKRLRGLEHLTSIHLSGTPVGDEEMDDLATFTRLRVVYLADTKVTGAGLAKLKPLARLQHLHLPKGTPADLLPALAELTSLELVEGMPAGLGDADLAYIGRLTKLRQVPLEQANLHGEGLVHLKNLTQVWQLSLPHDLPEDAWPYLADVQFQQLRSPASLGAAQLEFLRGNRRLADFTAAQHLTDAGLATLATFPAIEKLTLHACDRLTDEGLAALAQFPALKELQPPREMDPASMQHIAQIRTLKRLVLSECAGDLPVGPLAGHPTLQTLWLGKEFSNDDCAMLARMPALVEARFHQSAVTADGINKLRDAPRLVRLSFSNVKLGEEEVKALSSLKQLKYLRLQKAGLSLQQLDSFRTANPQILLNWSD